MKARSKRPRWLSVDKIARKFVQIGFLLLFLYPFLPVLYKRLTYRSAPMLTSWSLPWDPLLFLGQLFHRDWEMLVIGAPLLLLAATLILGRFFCGWVCPMGTILDLVRPLARWQKRLLKKNPQGQNSPAKYYVLAAVLVSSFFSLQILGMLDPLVIVNRAASTLLLDALALQRPLFRMYLTASFLLVGIVGLELWRPRFWCRHLCPLGALLSLFSRWSLLNRKVSAACNYCGQCQRTCSMHAVGSDPHDTDYAECHMCLACEDICPQKAIRFRWGDLASKLWRPKSGAQDAPRKRERQGEYVSKQERLLGLRLSRRGLLGGAASGVAGLALTPLLLKTGQPGALRPPGALPEEQFVRTCILCQECVRVCPTGGLRPALFEAGLAAIGTPQLVPRQGACSLNPSCPHLCAQVCPVGAIRPIPREEMKIGLAKVHHELCLAWDQGVKCLVCVEACLVHATQVYKGRVVVDPDKCTGCGRCQSACPVVDGAIRVYPCKA
jgi:polyferredoxin/Na+-translocating ferredoxin:NAD+ oxidoreductase RNF subunit RnfB